jgi:[acyl-carrier-protein] S-malonyltransferase
MGKLAFMFPGQASQAPGMGKDLAEKFPAARAVFDEADQVLGFSISRMCFAGSEEELKQTANTQPAILTVSVAAYRVLAGQGTGLDILPAYVAGHSLGEYSALVASGALEFADALRLVRQRGTFMQEAVPEGEGAMAAIMGLSPAQVGDVCKRAAEGQVVSPANLNAPEQTVISGNAAAVKRAVELASQSGAKRAVMLAVSAPFHCALMQPAQAQMEPALRAVKFNDLRVPLVTNTDAEITSSGAESREALIRQITLPVRWEESIRELIAQGVTSFVEVGPGKVLCGLLRQIERSVHSMNVEDEATLRAAQAKLAQAHSETGEKDEV